MEKNYPPYTITDKMLNYATDIMKKIGEANYFESLNRYPELRRKSRIKSIHSSLAIENNQLSLFQVEDVINGKPVMGEQKDIQEVKNAYEAYEQIDKVNPYSVEDLKKIHGILTFLVEKDAGKFRNHGEGVYDGDVCIFTCPPHKLVPDLMDNLFNWMNEVKDTISPLILSCIFHYEFVFIHPFHDGNGRTARLWQTAILAHWEKAFTYLPIESMIKKNQEEYYTAIQNCNNAGNSNEFIEFMLKMISETVSNLLETTTQEITQETTQEKILKLIKNNPSITQVEMSKKLGITRDGISYHIKILKDNGIIEREGSTKKGSWRIIEK
ncbi:MAG: Fic family protein [Clostridia bacterium]|nr:Fic family protein [Clostridia bacterium]